MPNAQGVEAILFVQRRRSPQAGPVARCFPVVAAGVLAYDFAVCRIAVAVRDPGRGLRWFSTACSSQIAAVVHCDDGSSVFHIIQQPGKVAEVVIRLVITILRGLFALPWRGLVIGPMIGVGVGASGVAKHIDCGGIQQGDNLRIDKAGGINGCVNSKGTVSNDVAHLRCLDRDLDIGDADL